MSQALETAADRERRLADEQRKRRAEETQANIATIESIDLELRPVFHWSAPRLRAHVLLCVLAYYLEWHMRGALAPLLFDEHDPAGRDAERASPVAKAKASPAARRKASRKRTDPAAGESLPVHSFRCSPTWPR